MARIRSVKPTFWTDEKIGLLPRDTRLTFLGLISAMADDHGRLSGVPRIVRGAVYPFDEDVTTADVERQLGELEAAGLILRYTVNGAAYVHIRSWTKHQKVDRPSASLLPAPPDESSDVRESFDESTTNNRRPIPTDRKGEERERREKGAETRPATTASSNAEPPRSAPLPAVVLEWAGRFYATAAAERKRDVHAQLVGVLGDGTAFEGQRVTASTDRLIAKCQEMLDGERRQTTRLRQPDAAIAVLLRKLADTSDGSAPGLVAAIAEKQADETDAAAIAAWVDAHPDEVQAIHAKMRRLFPSEAQRTAREACFAGEVRKRMTDTAA